MTDRAAQLMTMILERPDDDGPRLVYADWLEEFRPTPDAGNRAEFIRIQIERNHRAQSGQRMDDDERAMRDRESELWEQYQSKWFKDFLLWPVPPVIIVRRGFLDTLRCSGQMFANLPFEGLFARHPLREIIVNDWAGYDQQISSTIPRQLRYLGLEDGLMTYSQAVMFTSFNLAKGWRYTLEELAVESCNARAERHLKAELPKTRLWLETGYWSAASPTGARELLQPRDRGAIALPETEGER